MRDVHCLAACATRLCATSKGGAAATATEGGREMKRRERWRVAGKRGALAARHAHCTLARRLPFMASIQSAQPDIGACRCRSETLNCCLLTNLPLYSPPAVQSPDIHTLVYKFRIPCTRGMHGVAALSDYLRALVRQGQGFDLCTATCSNLRHRLMALLFPRNTLAKRIAHS